MPRVARSTNDTGNGASIRALDRAVSILNIFEGTSELRLSEIARSCGLTEPTVYRYLGTLVQHGWLVHLPNGGYRLGIRLFQLGQQAVAGLDVRKVATPHMQDLLEEFGETVNLAGRQGDAVVVIESLESPSSIRRGASVGQQDVWFSSGLGKAILANLPGEEVRRLHGEADLEALTERTITSLTDLFKDLDAIRARGYSLDDEESERGLVCVAAAIHDRNGQPTYALSVSGPTQRVRSSLRRGLGIRVVTAARQVSEEIGHSTSEAGAGPSL